MPDRQRETDDVRGYDPNSVDASFSRLFARMDSQDTVLHRIEGKIEGHGEKLNKLESERKFHWGMSISGALAAIHHTLLTLIGR
jgi:hypothetical protein